MAEPTGTTPNPAPHWLHAWAVFTVLATLPLLFLGAEVTTKGVGMADPVWPTHPLYLLLEGSGLERGIGFVIEHSHRLAGWTVGFCTIVLAVGLWLREPRAWVRWLGVTALLGVCLQGILGGFRVRLHDVLGTDLALIHGCFGQMVFALLVSLALCTSRRWRKSSADFASGETSSTLRHLSLLVVSLLVAQLILGAFVRHRLSPLAQRGHLLVAFAVLAAIIALSRAIAAEPSAGRNLRMASRLLLGLLAVQLVLGVEAWMIRAPHLAVGSEVMVAQPSLSLVSREVVRSVHVLVGSFLLATSVVTAMEAHRSYVLREAFLALTPAERQEVVA